MKTAWRVKAGVPSYKMDPGLRECLFDPGSTTARFKQISPHFKIRVLQQQWQQPQSSEILFLQMVPRTRALIREVEIVLHDVVWMVARTVIPATTLTGSQRRLIDQLDERPIGKLLFSDPHLKRTEYEVALLTPAHKEYAPLAHLKFISDPIWVRRSLFYLDHKPLMLIEYFLPPLVEELRKSS